MIRLVALLLLLTPLAWAEEPEPYAFVNRGDLAPITTALISADLAFVVEAEVKRCPSLTFVSHPQAKAIPKVLIRSTLIARTPDTVQVLLEAIDLPTLKIVGSALGEGRAPAAKLAERRAVDDALELLLDVAKPLRREPVEGMGLRWRHKFAAQPKQRNPLALGPVKVAIPRMGGTPDPAPLASAMLRHMAHRSGASTVLARDLPVLELRTKLYKRLGIDPPRPERPVQIGLLSIVAEKAGVELQRGGPPKPVHEYGFEIMLRGMADGRTIRDFGRGRCGGEPPALGRSRAIRAALGNMIDRLLVGGR